MFLSEQYFILVDIIQTFLHIYSFFYYKEKILLANSSLVSNTLEDEHLLKNGINKVIKSSRIRVEVDMRT